MADVAMPRLSDSMEEGTILKWLKSDGDEVARGDELVEIETDKANMTYEADQDGTLAIVAQEGDTLPVGETIAQIGEGGGGAGRRGPSERRPRRQPRDEEPEPEEAAARPRPARQGRRATPAASPRSSRAGGRAASRSRARRTHEDERASGDGNGRVKASPIARRMARELGVELSGVEGTGPGGRIVKADVEAAAATGGRSRRAAERRRRRRPSRSREAERPGRRRIRRAQTGRGETTQELTRLQQTIARRMAESKATAPEFVLTIEVDMEAAVALRKQLKAAAGDEPAPSFNDFVVKACALALREFPRANGAYRDGSFELYSRVNVGVAVAGQDALVVPTIFDADRKSLGADRPRGACARRARARRRDHPARALRRHVQRLQPRHVRDQRFVAVINPPQAAILAVGAMEPTPVARRRDRGARAAWR